MRRFFIITLFIALCPLGLSFSQDNPLGDYILSGSNKTISLDLKDANLVDVLKALSQQTGVNFISNEAVKKRTLTLYVNKVPLKRAMDIIFKANNLAYSYYPESNIFVVKEMGKPAIELKTKIYHLKYARVYSSRMEGEIQNKMVDTGSDSSSSGSSNSDSSTSTTGDTGIKEAVMQSLSEFGKVTEDPVTNSLVVIDVPSQFPIIDKVVNGLDIPVPKVMIDVEMLDVSKHLVDQIGVKFTNGIYGEFKGGAYDTAFPFPGRFLKSIQWSSDPTRELTLGTLDLRSFQMMMQFLTTDTSTKILARPKILTVSNEIAEVNLTTNEAIGVISTVTTEGTTESVERVETGTKLRVTPQVNPYTKEVTLFLEVFTKEAKPSGITLSSMSKGSLMNPEERGTNSVVRLKDGQTVLIGGLMKQDNTNTITKVPLLGDIPILGRLFRYKSKDKEKRELMVFLTPHVINDTVHSALGNTIKREQANTLKSQSVKIVLDKLSK